MYMANWCCNYVYVSCTILKPLSTLTSVLFYKLTACVCVHSVCMFTECCNYVYVSCTILEPPITLTYVLFNFYKLTAYVCVHRVRI